jgi:hypothetical protein
MNVSAEDPSNALTYDKKVSDSLSVRLKFREPKANAASVTIDFINTSKSNITISTNYDNDNNTNTNWLSSVFGGRRSLEANEENGLLPIDDINLFLGSLQLIGYVVLNYQFDLESGLSPLEMGGSATEHDKWWENTEYINQYSKYASGHELDDDIIDLLNAKSPFISASLKKPVEIGGKLAGVDDLVLGQNNRTMIESRKLPFLHDLIFPFNSMDSPISPEAKSKLALGELTSKIVPFYTTPQALLFSDVLIPSGSSKSFDINLPVSSSLPPSYNDKLPGPTCDNGLVSIRYSLNVSVREGKKMIPTTVYFPLDIKGDRFGNDPRWLQKEYFQDHQCDIDKTWKITTVENDAVENGTQAETISSREAFLNDLDNLIETDLHNMPNSTSHRRNKSVASVHEDPPGYIPQLPPHLKTSYQLRVNAAKLCDINLSRPFYHIGEDINFMINMDPHEGSEVKIVGYTTHLEAQETFHLVDSDPYIHTYRVTGNLKTNTFSPSLMNSMSSTKTTVSGNMNIPRFITQQFQAKLLINLTYYLVFKFNLVEFNNGLQENGTAEKTTMEESRLHILKQYRFGNEGSELKFRLKIVVLP